MNFESQPLQLHEIQTMKADPVIIERIIRSYELMLDFYGMQLVSAESGLLKRSDNYKGQYTNLMRQYIQNKISLWAETAHNCTGSPHNYLRISRIMKCLSEFGLERLNTGFLLHVLNEQSEHGTLNTPTLLNSMDRWWSNCLRDEGERKRTRELIHKVRNDDDSFVFTRAMYEGALKR